MKLRHKKPLNPYKGQTNNDKNEFNDDDFRQQASPHKKNGNTTGDQIFKYARILSKFIKTINQDCRLSYSHSEDPDHPHSTERTLLSGKHDLGLELQTSLKKQQLKEQKQISKLQAKIQLKQDNKEQRYTSRKKDNQTTASFSKQSRNQPQENSSMTLLTQNARQNAAKNQGENTNKNTNKANLDKIDQNIINCDGFNSTKAANPKININSQPSINPTPGMNLNGHSNLINYMNLPQNFPSMLNQNQLLGNLNMMGLNGLNNLNPMQVNQFLMRCNNANFIYGGIPVMNNINNMNMMGMGIPNMPGSSQYMYQHPKINQKPIENLFNEQVKTFKANPTNKKETKIAYPLKRSAFHVAIAYKIYLDRVKQQGVSFDNLQDIDPTKNARRIKSSQPKKATKDSKQPQKKKK